jgi:hypothetical protein
VYVRRTGGVLRERWGQYIYDNIIRARTLWDFHSHIYYLATFQLRCRCIIPEAHGRARRFSLVFLPSLQSLQGLDIILALIISS